MGFVLDLQSVRMHEAPGLPEKAQQQSSTPGPGHGYPPALPACTHAPTMFLRGKWFLCKSWQLKANQSNLPFLMLSIWSVSNKPIFSTYPCYSFLSWVLVIVHFIFQLTFQAGPILFLPQLYLTAKLELWVFIVTLSPGLVESTIHNLHLFKYLPWCWLYPVCTLHAQAMEGQVLATRVITELIWL